MIGNSRIASPTRGRIPKQIQRAIPIYFAVVFLFIFFLNFDLFSSSGDGSSSSALKKRNTPAQKPLKAGARFPRKIWQTWKVGPLGFDERDATTAKTWVEKNPSFRYEVLTDDNDMQYVEMHYGSDALNRPDIVEMYRSLNVKIVKADILRYLIMYAEGGVYADIDVEALRPVDRFIPERFNQGDIDLVIGVEIDQPDFTMHPILGRKSQSFCQWTFMAKPHQPVMLKLVDNIMVWLKGIAKEQGVPISEIKLDFDQVISGTGPSAFTIAILEAMSKKTKSSVVWDDFHNLYESKLVGGVLVLSVEAFAAGQGHSDSGNHNARSALVKHHYHASNWPTNHPRFSHPVYGEVEKCNWEPLCVHQWDEDVAAYELLSDEEKAAKISAKEILEIPPAPFM